LEHSKDLGPKPVPAFFLNAFNMAPSTNLEVTLVGALGTFKDLGPKPSQNLKKCQEIALGTSKQISPHNPMTVSKNMMRNQDLRASATH